MTEYGEEVPPEFQEINPPKSSVANHDNKTILAELGRYRPTQQASNKHQNRPKRTRIQISYDETNPQPRPRKRNAQYTNNGSTTQNQRQETGNNQSTPTKETADGAPQSKAETTHSYASAVQNKRNIEQISQISQSPPPTIINNNATPQQITRNETEMELRWKKMEDRMSKLEKDNEDLREMNKTLVKTTKKLQMEKATIENKYVALMELVLPQHLQATMVQKGVLIQRNIHEVTAIRRGEEEDDGDPTNMTMIKQQSSTTINKQGIDASHDNGTTDIQKC